MKDTIQEAAQFAKGKHDHYLRVKTEGVNPFNGNGNAYTVLLRVEAAGNLLLGEEVTMRDGDTGLAVYGVIRNGAEQLHFISWDAVIWAKVVHFNWYEGTLDTIMEVK